MLRRLALAVTGLSLLLAAGIAPAAERITLVGQNNLRYSKEQITVAPGEKVELKLVNKSRLPASAMSHNWVLLKPGTDAEAFDAAAQSAAANDYFPADRADQTLAHTRMVAGGDSDTITFTAPEQPGEYRYICTFPGHYNAGMTGTLVVDPDV